MQSPSEALASTPAVPNANPTPFHPHANPQQAAPRRRPTQRVFLKDRPEVICQMQMNEIQKLNDHLANYRHQHRVMTEGHVDQRRSQQKKQTVNGHQPKHDQTLKQILSTGEEFRNELMAAHEKRAHLIHQNTAIQRQMEAFNRQKESMIAEINNQRTKISILEQQIFIVKNAFDKYKSKTQGEKQSLNYEIKTLRANAADLEALVRDMSPKMSLLPIYEQKLAESENRIGLLNQQVAQIRGDLRYYQQKSNYFETNYTVLNQNFNNLYNTNFNLNNQHKEAKNTITKLELTIKLLEDQCRKLTSQCFELTEQKNKFSSQLNSEIAMLSERIKNEKKTVELTQKSNQKLTSYVEEATKNIHELQTKNHHLERQIQSKIKNIKQQKIVNDQQQHRLKQFENSLQKQGQAWKNTLANELSKISNESNAKVMLVSSELIKSQQNCKSLIIKLTKTEEQLETLKERTYKLERKLEQASQQLFQKEKSNQMLKELLQKAKIQEIFFKNSINGFQNKLSTALTVQEQMSINSKANFEQKTAKIKQLQDKIDELHEENLTLQLQRNDLLQEIAKLTEISNMLKNDLEYSREENVGLQERLEEVQKKGQWLNEQNSTKEQMIIRYNSVVQEMRQRISSMHNEIVELNNSKQSLEEDLSSCKILLQQRNAQMIQKAKTFYEQMDQNSIIINTLNKEIEKLKSGLNSQNDINNQIKSQNKKLKQQKTVLEQANNKLKSQNDSKTNEVQKLVQERAQMAHLIQIKIDNIQKLKISLIQLDETYRKSIQESSRLHEQRKNTMVSQWNIEKSSLVQKVNQGNSHLQRNVQLQKEVVNVSEMAQEYKIRLEQQKIRVQNLLNENETMRKTLKQMQEIFKSQLEREKQMQQMHLNQLKEQIQSVKSLNSAIKSQNQKFAHRLAQKIYQLEHLSKENQKMEHMLRRNMETSRAQVQFLKKANINLQIQLHNINQATQHDSKIKSDLLNSVTALQMKLSLFEEQTNKTKDQLACIQPIFQQLKQERDLLIKKYIILTNQICKINSKDINLNRQLDSFAQYFSKVSVLHTEINKHLNNINNNFSQVRHVSQVGQSPRFQQSYVEKVKN